MKLQAKKWLFLFSLCFTLSLATPPPVAAQCPMCKMSAQKNLESGGTAGAGLNKGILYMLLTPYFVIGGIGFFWYKNRKKQVE